MRHMPWSAMLVALLWPLLFAEIAWPQDVVRLDLSGDWPRRDWAKCASNAELVAGRDTATVTGDTSAVLFWRTPTRSGQPLAVDGSKQWIRECDIPSPDFGENLRKADLSKGILLQVSEYQHVAWQWSVDKTVDDTNMNVEDEKKFTARLGITVVRKGGSDLREIAYVWARTRPEESVIVHTTTVAGMWKYRWHRIVVESGETNLGKWANESRNLYTDYKRLYPDEEPGRIVRIYLRVDSERKNRTTGSFANVTFHRRKPE